MAKNEIVPQYYNLFDSTLGYTELLFRAGKVLQSKELNELQSILKNQIKNVGNTILTNGDIIEGCQLVISDDRTTVTMTKGRIYLDGDVRDVPDTVLNIAGTGTEVIGAILQTEVITPDEDPNLADIATGYDNYNQDGAYRVKETVKITLNNPNASILYNLINGEQLTVNKSEDLTQLDKIHATLAKRTFEESGNYKVSGLNLSDKQQNDTDHIYITLEAGKAYVRGYEVTKSVAYTVRLDRASDLRNVENESKQFRLGTNEYVLNNNYVNSIKKILAEVQVTGNITRGGIIGGIDYLTLSPVAKIVSVTQGSTVYIEGTDFQLLNDGIDWSIGSKAPNPNTTYQVVWTYNKTLLKEVDYTLKHSDTWENGYVQFTTAGDKPVDGTRFYVNYDFMLCRRDTIGIDQYGNVLITKGQSDILRTVESPKVGNDNQLVLGSVLLIPKSNEVNIINNNTKTIRMLELYNMLERINDLEYNQAVSDLDQEAAEGENATELRGILTDGFIGLTKADVNHPEWSGCLDFEKRELTIQSTETIVKLVPDTASSYYKAHKFSNYQLSNAFTEVQQSQPSASSSFRVNAYDAFPKLPVLTLNPSKDEWIDTENIKLEGLDVINIPGGTLRRWWYHQGESWAASEKQKWIEAGFPDGGESLGWADGTSTSDIYYRLVSSLEKSIVYMRQINVEVLIENLEPFVDNILATFNGIPVALSATEAKYTGSREGSLKADASGIAKGQFMVPPNVKCETAVEVRIYPANTPSIIGNAEYTASGTLITNTYKAAQQRITTRATDPVAQSFQFGQDQYLTGIGLYFLDKEENRNITIEIHNMINGYPGNIAYVTKVVNGASIQPSSDASQETKIMFDIPFHCRANEQYCFTVISDSDVDSVWIAETGALDISNANNQISKNPYMDGMMFSSSNALTWTAHQSQDLKFKLYLAQFETTGQVSFNKITDVNFERFKIASTEELPVGCTLEWQYSINDGAWLPIESGIDREIGEIGESIQIRCNFKGNTVASPILDTDNLTLGLYSLKDKSVYVSRNVNIPNGFNHVKAIMDMYLPSGSNVIVTYATDISGTNWKSLTNTETVQKSSTYKTYTFEADLDEAVTNYRVKIELTTVNPLSRPRVQNLKNILKTV